ncbi:MAG: hypothetical protein PHQ36_13460 [Anaerolineales bacterium]|nr:hypothetical protein [Anaerolineales bacterium]
MRKIIFIFLFSLLLQSCSALPFGKTTPTSTSKPTLTSTATVTPTSTRTPTITPSPTIVKIPTIDYNATVTPPAYIYNSPTPFPGIPTSTPVATVTPLTPDVGFEWLRVSSPIFYWGICKPQEVKVSVQVSEPKDVYSVTLFVRLRRLTSKNFTEWNKGMGMEHLGDGIWSYNLNANSIDGHQYFRRGWVWYQVVAIGANDVEIARTRIYMDTLKLQPCMCMTPPCGP